MQANLSDKLLPDLQQSGRIVFCCGTKRAGKSLLCLSILRQCLEADLFNDYIVILGIDPKLEQHNTYQWIKDMANQKSKVGVNVYFGQELHAASLYKHLTDQKIKSLKDKKTTRKTLLIADDQTGVQSLFQANSAQGSDMVKLLTRVRHFEMSCIFIVHSVTCVMNSVVKNMCDWFVMMQSPCKKVTDKVWEEWLSRRMPYDEFNRLVNATMDKDEFPAIIISTFGGQKYDTNIQNWEWISKQRKIIMRSLT